MTTARDRAETRVGAVEALATCRGHLWPTGLCIGISAFFFMWEFHMYSTEVELSSAIHGTLALVHILFGAAHVHNLSADLAMIATCRELIKTIDDLSEIERTQLLGDDPPE